MGTVTGWAGPRPGWLPRPASCGGCWRPMVGLCPHATRCRAWGCPGLVQACLWCQVPWRDPVLVLAFWWVGLGPHRIGCSAWRVPGLVPTGWWVELGPGTNRLQGRLHNGTHQRQCSCGQTRSQRGCGHLPRPQVSSSLPGDSPRSAGGSGPGSSQVNGPGIRGTDATHSRSVCPGPAQHLGTEDSALHLPG